MTQHHEAAHDGGHDHAHGHAQRNANDNNRLDVLKVGGFLVFIFLCSMASHYLFAKEGLATWLQNRQNAQAAEQIQPGHGDAR